MFTHRHRCTQFACATLYFFTFLRGQQHRVSMIDLVSEGESVYSEFSVRGHWVSSCWKHTHMCYCMASRDTMPDLHLAEHKWVKRNYNTEQSSLLTPPGAYRLLQSAPALFTPLGVLSTSQTRLAVRSNGVGHQALLKMGGKKRNKYWFENVLFCYFQKLSSVLFFLSVLAECLRSRFRSL